MLILDYGGGGRVHVPKYGNQMKFSPVKIRFQVGQIATKLEPNFLEGFYVINHHEKGEICGNPPFGGVCMM